MQQLTVENIKEQAAPILKNAGIKKSTLIGSYVRGKQKLQKNVDLLSYNAISPLIKDTLLQHQYPLL